MTTALGTLSPAPAPAASGTDAPDTLTVYLDAGPLARLLGRPTPRRAPGAALAALGVAPLALAWLLRGTDLDDGTIAVLLGWFVLLGSAAGARTHHRLGWLVPPIVRGGEYATIAFLAVAADALPAAYLLLSVLCFHHYDAVYRLRHQRQAPPAWLALVGGGWELRVLACFGLFLAGEVALGYVLAAVLLGVVYVAESIRGWVRFSRSTRQSAPVQSEDEEEDE